MINSIKTECPEATIWELMAEIDRLKKENKLLVNQNIELKLNNELLHNSIEGINQDYEEINDFQICDSVEDLEAYANAFNNYSLK